MSLRHEARRLAKDHYRTLNTKARKVYARGITKALRTGSGLAHAMTKKMHRRIARQARKH